MVKNILILVFIFCFFNSYAQEPAYTPMRLNYQFRGIKVDSLFLIPSFNDTTAANNSTMKNVAGAMIRTGNDFWMRNATTNAWLQNVNVGTGASPSIQFVDSVWRVVGKDSIFWRKGGTTNKIKDSVLGRIGIDTVLAVVDSLKANRSININGKKFTTKNGSNVYGFDINKTGVPNDYIRLNNNTGEMVELTNTYLTISRDNEYNQYMFLNFQNHWVKCTPGYGGWFIDSSGGYYGAERYNENKVISKYETSSGNLIIYDSTSGTLTEYIKIKRSTKELNFKGDTITTNGQIKFQAADGTVIKAGDFTDANKIGNVLYNRGSDNANTNGGDFHAYIPGVFKMNDASSSNDFFLPDATLFPGQMCIVINKDATDATGLAVENSGGVIYDKGTATQITSLPATEMGTFFSDGANWYGFTQ